MKKELILASKSKRRQEILKSCGINYKVFATYVKEVSHDKIHSARLVVENAKRKAQAAAKHFKRGIVLGVDTIVLFKGKNIGKPKNERHARNMLKAFSGQKIAVYSGLYIIGVKAAKKAWLVDKTILKVKHISDRDITRFFLRLGPYDRAGGFSIEGPGSLIFDDLKGSYFNVLGLPMGKLADLFEKIGLDILDFIPRR
jgi:septum formation protein